MSDYVVDLSDYSKEIVDKFMKDLEKSSSVKWRAGQNPTEYDITKSEPILHYWCECLTKTNEVSSETIVLTRALFIKKVSEEMPKKPEVKELTVKEISKLLGYEIKVVK